MDDRRYDFSCLKRSKGSSHLPATKAEKQTFTVFDIRLLLMVGQSINMKSDAASPRYVAPVKALINVV